MDQKFFFFDIDNTLVPWPSGKIPEDTKYALAELKKQGHRIAIATGRLQADALPFAEEAGIVDFVADGGYSVTINKELSYMRSLDLDKCHKLIEQLENFQIPWAITTANKMESLTHFAHIQKHYAPWDHFELIYKPGLDYKKAEQIYKITIYLDEKDEDKHTIDFGELETIRYGKYTVLIEPMEKSYGIKMLADHYGVPYKDIVTFGDGNNDIRMFDPQWTNIAMGNGRERLKALADYVTTDCKDGGILHACKHFGWIK